MYRVYSLPSPYVWHRQSPDPHNTIGYKIDMKIEGWMFLLNNAVTVTSQREKKSKLFLGWLVPFLCDACGETHLNGSHQVSQGSDTVQSCCLARIISDLDCSVNRSAEMLQSQLLFLSMPEMMKLLSKCLPEVFFQTYITSLLTLSLILYKHFQAKVFFYVRLSGYLHLFTVLHVSHK